MKSIFKRAAFATALLFILTLVSWPMSVKADSAPAKVTVATYHTDMLNALKSDDAKSAIGRFNLFAPIMDVAFDFQTMIKTVAGQHWRKADTADQEALRDAFRRVSIATYANRFKDLSSDAAFIIQAVKDGPRRMKLVESTLEAGKEPVALTYVVRNTENGWRIIDVLLDGGISELALRASEYARMLETGGAAALHATLNAQADGLLRP